MDGGIVSRAATRAAQGLAYVAIVALMLLAMGTVADVILRYGFAQPIRGFVDLASLAGAVLLAACFPYVLACRGNIAIDALGHWLGQAASRWLDRLSSLVSAGFFGVMAWQFWRYAEGLREDGEVIPVLRWPVWPWWTAVAVFIALAALTALLTVNAQRGEST